MRHTFRILGLLTVLVSCERASVVEMNGLSDVKPSMDKVTGFVAQAPRAKKIPHEMLHHGMTRIDNYYWMRDDDRKSPPVLAHLQAENSYATSALQHTESLQEKLFGEITNRMKKDDSSVPFKYKNYYYYSRFEGEKEYPVYARKKYSLDAPEEILLDGNAMAEGLKYFDIGDYTVSASEKILAYSSDSLGRRIYDIFFKDLETGELLSDTLSQTTGQIIWANDNLTVFYIRKDPQTLLGYQVFRHVLGTKQSQDVLVYEEKDKSFYTWLDKSKDDSTVIIVHSATITQGASLIDADQPSANFELFAPLEANHEYSIAKRGDWFYVLTNWQAQNFRLMKVHASNTRDKSEWQEVIGHNEDVLLQSFEVFEKYLAVSEREKGQSRVRVINLKDKRSHVVVFDDPVYVAAFTTNVSIDTEVLRLRYSSLTTPFSTYDYDMTSREKVLLKREQVVGEFDPARYQSERIFVAAGDGKEIPVSIVYRRDKFSKDGTNPLVQYGYGSYGHNIEPYFSGARLSLLDRGFVFAIAHIRGSQTLGRAWYDDGKMFNKINTFTDFIDVTKALVEQKYGAKEQVFAAGGSAGGLLIGAVINMAPKLYRGVAAHVPFVDVVTTMLDETIPLTTNEYHEWGNPNNRASYEYMLSYSPYDNVSVQQYPNILVTTGLHDSQVQYFEPAKWVAKLREYKTDDNILVFRIDLDSGHGGVSGRFKRNKLRALEYAFFMDLAGMSE